MVTFNQILCPIDFSEFSRRALDHALSVARCYRSSVTALHVVSPMPVVVPNPYYFQTETPPPMMLPPVDRAAVVAQLQRLAEEERIPGVKVESRVAERQFSRTGVRHKMDGTQVVESGKSVSDLADAIAVRI